MVLKTVSERKVNCYMTVDLNSIGTQGQKSHDSRSNQYLISSFKRSVFTSNMTNAILKRFKTRQINMSESNVKKIKYMTMLSELKVEQLMKVVLLIHKIRIN